MDTGEGKIISEARTRARDDDGVIVYIYTHREGWKEPGKSALQGV